MVAKLIEQGPYESVSKRGCCQCRMELGSNAGRCITCAFAQKDFNVSRYIDWLIENSFDPRTGEEARQVLEEHGPLLIPR